MSANKSECEWAFAERVLSCPAARVVYIWGRPGTGKTHAAYYLGTTSNGIFPLTMTQDTPSSEARGHYVPEGDRFVWQDGMFTAAMRAGGRLIVNEITHAPAEILALAYAVFESPETAQLMLPTGEIVRPAPGFQVVVTDNEPPNALPEALQDRFNAKLEITTPHPDALARLRPELRHAAERTLNLDDERRIGLRAWLDVERLAAPGQLNLKDACRAVFGAPRGAQVYEAIVLAAGSLKNLDVGEGGAS